MMHVLRSIWTRLLLGQDKAHAPFSDKPNLPMGVVLHAPVSVCACVLVNSRDSMELRAIGRWVSFVHCQVPERDDAARCTRYAVPCCTSILCGGRRTLLCGGESEWIL